MRWPFVSRTTYHAACAHIDRLTAVLEHEQGMHASADALVGECLRLLLPRVTAARGVQPRDLSMAWSAITDADLNAPAPAETAVLAAVTPAVLHACRQFAYGDRRQESANRAHVYRLARQGADEATILRALRLGDREGVA